ncbi:MAG: flagellar basal body P-ring protein FlgI [Planctomycetota bacterium]
MRSVKASGVALAVFFLAASWCGTAGAVRIKDIARLRGVRDNNTLQGYGLVMGLNGTGDRGNSVFTALKISEMMIKLGFNIPAQQLNVVRNSAAVMVTANLPPFAEEGERIDVTVSSLGNASSLQGGELLVTPLMGPDGEVYGVAQGPISIGGFAVAGGAGQRVQQNHPTVGRVPGGAVLERTVPVSFVEGGSADGEPLSVTLLLRHPDFTTARHIEETVNQQFEAEVGRVIARAESGGAVVIEIPENYRKAPVPFIAQIERLPIFVDREAKVIINEKTGTVIIGENVRVSPVAISHGNLSLVVGGGAQSSEAGPAPTAQEGSGQRLVSLYTKDNEGATLQDVVNALNTIKVSARDLISILQALQREGALQAKLDIM